MPVRLLRPQFGQPVNTLYWAPQDVEDSLRATGNADDQVELASDYSPLTRILYGSTGNTSRNATTYKMPGTTAQTLTLQPSGYWPSGGVITIVSQNVGPAIVTPATGVTINGGTASVTVAAPNSEARLLKVGPDTWVTMDGFTGQAASALAAVGVASATPRIGSFGDSRTAIGFNYTTNYGYVNAGYMTFLRHLTRQRFVHTGDDVFATSGFNTQNMIDTWLAKAVASPCVGMIVLATTNDRTSGLTVQQSIDNMNTIINALLGAGKWVCLIAEMPRGDATFNPTYRLTAPFISNHASLHRWFQQQASRPNVYVVDPWPSLLADPTSSDATAGLDIASGMTYDGLHPAGRGAFTLAKLLQPIIEQKLPLAEILPTSNFDTFSADNPRGSITPNPMLSGSGGFLVPTTGTLSGTVPANLRAETINCAGVTVALSIVTVNGQSWWQAAISGTPTQANAFLQLRHLAQTINQGDMVEAVLEYQVDAGQTGLNSVQLAWNDSTGSFYYTDGRALVNTYNYPIVAVAGVLRTPVMSAAATGSLSDSFEIHLLQNVAVSATVRIRAFSMRKVL